MTFALARSAIYVPGDHERAMQKATSLEADIIIFDLEDGVAPERKPIAFENIQNLLRSTEFPNHTVIVRINHRSTGYYTTDVAAMAALPVDGVMLSKVASPDDVDDAVSYLATYGRADCGIWCNIETPQGVAHAMEIAAHKNVAALVAGTNDLSNDLRIRYTPERAGLTFSLQRILLAARAHDRIALDGTFVNLDDMDGLKAEAEQGRTYGFEGKTLIHPKQIDVANKVFSPSTEELDFANRVIDTYEEALRDDKAVTLIDGVMIEALHYAWAKKILAMDAAIKAK